MERILNNLIHEIINPIIALLFAGALVFFLWGVFRYFILDAGEAKDQGRRHMIWGIVGMVIMVGVLGILRLLARTLGVDLPPGL